MADFHHPDDGPHRSFMYNPSVQVETMRIDVSDMPPGRMDGVLLSNEFDDENGVELCRRRLFVQEAPRGWFGEQSSSTAENHVTMAPSQPSPTTTGLQNSVPPPSIPNDSGALLLAASYEEPSVAAVLDTALQATKRRRVRASYAKKFFYGEPDMYLDIDPTKQTAEFTPELLGQVKTCPNKKNQNLYEISWIRPKDPMVQWPPNLKYHLRILFHKNEIHKQLASLIDGCSLNRDLSPATVSLPTTQTPTQLLPSQTTTQMPLSAPRPEAHQVAPAARPLSIIETPSPTQNAAFAALQTAGSISSISSLGNSDFSNSNTSRRQNAFTRRASRMVSEMGVDSDDNTTASEASYEVDFSDNFWSNQYGLDERDLDENFTEHERDEIHVPAGAGPSDFARMLDQCTQFEFCQFIQDESEPGPTPQPLYEGPSGLKRNAARSFSTPLGAFQRCGLTEDLVSHWTTNSNQ